MISFLGNLVWLLFGGFIAAAGYILGGALLCLTIIGIPFGLQAMRLGVATMTPFGKQVVSQQREGGFVFLLMDILWAILFGWEIALAHLAGALLLAITILGIPFALQHVKLVPVALFPFHFRLE